MHSPLASIVIPAFNDSAYLLPTLDHCLSQTHRPLEIVVVDDGSTDDTARALGGLVAAGTIRYARQENMGPAAARNHGLQLARGAYVQFLDADDRLAPDKIAKQVNQLAAIGPPAVAYSDYRIFRGNDVSNATRLGPAHAEAWPASFAVQFHQWTVVHRFLYPRRLLLEHGGFDSELYFAEDLELWMRLIIRGVKFIYDPQPLAYYRFRDGRSVREPAAEARGRLLALSKLERLLEERGELARHAGEIEQCRRELVLRCTDAEGRAGR